MVTAASLSAGIAQVEKQLSQPGILVYDTWTKKLLCKDFSSFERFKTVKSGTVLTVDLLGQMLSHCVGYENSYKINSDLKKMLHQYLVDTVQRVNSIADVLDSLKWDGVVRLGLEGESWLTTYCGIYHEPHYTPVVARQMLVNVLRRIKYPGCKQDELPILVGAQGLGKTTLCDILAAPFTEKSDRVRPNIKFEDFARLLKGKIIVELSEFDQYAKKHAYLKDLLESTTDKFIDKYQTEETISQRSCCFIGTTNRTTCLLDPTGNRRYYPLQMMRPIDFDRLREIIPSLYAEALQHIDTKFITITPEIQEYKDNFDKYAGAKKILKNLLDGVDDLSEAKMSLKTGSLGLSDGVITDILNNIGYVKINGNWAKTLSS